jgi:hypothetical protein
MTSNGLTTQKPEQPGDALRIQNLYADADGESHWRDVYYPLGASGPGIGTLVLETAGVQFRVAAGAYDINWHCAPLKQLMVILAGGALKVTASDGEARILHPGDVLLVEDTTGKGHLSQSIDGLARRQMFVRLAPS